MGNTFPKQDCLTNCLERVGLTCEDRGLQRPLGEKGAKVRLQCESQCVEINAITSINHASDQFVSSLADGFCGPPRGGGKKKSEHYSVEIRGTGTDTMDSGEGSGTKSQKIDYKIKTADQVIEIIEMRRDSRVWYQSFSDLLGGPSEPSLQNLEPLKSLISAAKAKRASGDLKEAEEILDQTLKTSFSIDGEYDDYQRNSLDHAVKVAKIQGVAGAILFVVGTAGAALAYGLGGTAAAGSVAGGGEVISLTARLAARQGVQEALKKAALILFGLGVEKQAEHPNR